MFKDMTALLFVVLTITCMDASEKEVLSIPPAFYVDYDACPFECCTYQEWSVEKDTVLYEEANESSPIVSLLRTSETVSGLTGFVLTERAGRIRVLKGFTSPESGLRYKKGDLIYVYTNKGEGFFKVWYKGRFYTEEISFLSGWDICENEGDCWGEVLNIPESIWWVKVKDSREKTGWSGSLKIFRTKMPVASAEKKKRRENGYMSMGIELFIAPAVIVAYLALERYIKFRAHIYDGMNEGPECDSVEAFDLSSGPKYTYDEEHSFTIRDALNKKEYALLNKIIVPMQKDSINNFGLSFLADVDEAILKDKKLLSLLRELTGTKADETVLLYIRSETEKRVYDDYDYDYVYRYYYVFLTPQNSFVEVFANSEYSPTFEGD